MTTATGPTIVVAYPPDPPAEQVARLATVAPGGEVLVCPYAEDHGRRTARGSGGRVEDFPAPVLDEGQREVLARAEVLLTLDVPVDVTALAPKLRWVQAIGAGVDHLRDARLADSGVVLTNAAGLAAGSIAEFVIGRLLAVWKRFDLLADQQRRHVWEPAYGRDLAGSTVAVVGLGAIGTAVAQRARALGTRVVAVRRTPGAASPVADEVVGPDRLLDVLGRCDAVVLSAPSTPETRDLFDADAFAAMRPGAVFCNVARGALVDEDALVDALTSGHLGAAVLDVTKQEPLPPDSRLWDVPRLHLSPHSAASVDRYVALLFDLFLENLRRYVAGEPLRNVVDLAAGY